MYATMEIEDRAMHNNFKKKKKAAMLAEINELGYVLHDSQTKIMS